jgi:hypothetical protein
VKELADGRLGAREHGEPLVDRGLVDGAVGRVAAPHDEAATTVAHGELAALGVREERLAARLGLVEADERREHEVEAVHRLHGVRVTTVELSNRVAAEAHGVVEHVLAAHTRLDALADDRERLVECREVDSVGDFVSADARCLAGTLPTPRMVTSAAAWRP